MNYREAIENAGFEVEEVRKYMHRLRDSGAVNMFGSGEYLSGQFGFDRREAKEVVLGYMEDGLGEAA